MVANSINMYTVKNRMVHWMKIMTIEPIIFLQAVALNLTTISVSQMILYKTCRGDKCTLHCIICIDGLRSIVHMPFL